MDFKKWKLEVQRLLYEGGHSDFNISTVDEAEEYWEEKYNNGTSPEQAIQEAVDESIDDVID